VRPAGTVGGDDGVLRSSLPAPGLQDEHDARGAQNASDAQNPPDAENAPDAGPAAPPPSASPVAPPAAAPPARAPDDLDVGWGAAVDDSNDERLTREKPPHW